MGGLGSGRWPGYMSLTIPLKETTEDYFPLDIRAVKRHGLIAPGTEEIPGVALIEWVSSGFGAREGTFLRPWFLCPRDGCGRRVAILYGRTDTESHPEWACRRCLDLCYPVEMESHAERAGRRMHKARARLGSGAEKPKRMRHETFVRLGMKYLEARKEYVEALREQHLRTLEQMEQERIKYDL